MCIDLERDAFAGLVTTLAQAHLPALAAIARREGLAPVDALDAVQDAFHVFLHLPKARSLLDEPDEARVLLGVLVRNAARNLRRRHHRALPHDELDTEAPADELPPVESMLEQAERQAQLAGCLRQLDDVKRQIVMLRMLEELSGAEVARTLDLAPGHVAVLLHRAKKDLRRCMEDAPA